MRRGALRDSKTVKNNLFLLLKWFDDVTVLGIEPRKRYALHLECTRQSVAFAHSVDYTLSLHRHVANMSLAHIRLVSEHSPLSAKRL